MIAKIWSPFSTFKQPKQNIVKNYLFVEESSGFIKSGKKRLYYLSVVEFLKKLCLDCCCINSYWLFVT